MCCLSCSGARSRCRIQQHVAPGTADLLVAAEQALPLVSGGFRNVDGAGVPGLDVQLDPVQARDGPREGGQRLATRWSRCRGVQRGNRVAAVARPPTGPAAPGRSRQRLAGLGIGDGERVRFVRRAGRAADGSTPAPAAVGWAGRLPMRGMYGSSPNSTARWASSSVNSRRTTEPWVGGVVGQDGSCAVMCRLSLWSASRTA